MLGNERVTAFIATAQPGRAKQFYRDTLGLRFVSDDQFALVFDCAGVQLRIQKVETLRPHAFTALGWQVASIRQSVSALVKRGVVFERYGFMEQDELGIWKAPSGAKVAWLKDPDGNLLSLTETGLPDKAPRPSSPGARRRTAKRASVRRPRRSIGGHA
jgi:catechol 2,3-dioxygenase-like lactoylglutathione lyase family enzyme